MKKPIPSLCGRLACALIAMLLLTVTASAQDSEYTTGLSAKKLWLDYQALYGGEPANFQGIGQGVELGFSKSLSDRFNLYVPVKIGTIMRDSASRRDFTIGIDAQAHYYLLTRGRKFNPYVLAGVGIVMEDGNKVEDIDDFDEEVAGETNFQIPLGVGVDIMFHRRGYFNVQAEYRNSSAEGRNNLQGAVGFTYLIGRDSEEEEIMEEIMEEKDSDMDGVIDDLDLCPQTPGLEIFNGCPDTDRDGIMDPRDDCPEIPGTEAMRGCPDTDGDGVSDNDDECPTIPGLISNNGCPADDNNKDSDGDGVIDRLDRCPNVRGVAEHQGCPPPDNKVVIDPNGPDKDGDGVPDAQDVCPDLPGLPSAGGCPDADGDGISDILDECPNVPGLRIYDGCPDSDNDGTPDKFDDCPGVYGPKSNRGCPQIAQEDQDVLDFAMRAVQFDTGSDNLKAESYRILDQVADVMRNYPNFNLEVNGHTDSRGEASTNQRLSERRAKACYEYLLSRGFEQIRLTYAGFGESKPIATNDTPDGRALNRRTEFKVYPRGQR